MGHSDSNAMTNAAVNLSVYTDSQVSNACLDNASGLDHERPH